MEAITDLQCGKVGEHLVCADLILSGFVAFPAEEGLPFDVVAEVEGRLVRIQVKTTRTATRGTNRRASTKVYVFSARRCGKGGRGSYAASAVDLFAFVALDSREIGYFAMRDVATCMVFRSPMESGKYLDERNVERNARIIDLAASGMRQCRIAEEVGATKQVVYEVIRGRRGIPVSGRYLKEFLFSDALRAGGFIKRRRK